MQVTNDSILRDMSANGKILPNLSGGQIGRIFKMLRKQEGIEDRYVRTMRGHPIRVGASQDLLMKGASLHK